MTDYTLTDESSVVLNFGATSSKIDTYTAKNITTAVNGGGSVNIELNVDKNTNISSGNTVGFVSQAQWLIVEKAAGENIEQYRMIRFQDANTVVYAKSDGTKEDARSIGITITAAPVGGTVKILILGIVESELFTWPTGTLLFLSSNGAITSTVPTSGYSAVVAESLAVGVISLSIRTPIRL